LSRRAQLNPELFVFEPEKHYPWRVFERVTVAVITFNRLDYSRKLFASLQQNTHMPFELLVIENGSDDGTREFLEELSQHWPHCRVVHNRRNIGKTRAVLQIRDMVEDGLVVLFDNDAEMLSNYWLVHLLKAYHAARLTLGTTDIAFGFRLLNCEEYGFRCALSHDVLRIPSAQNALPRTSYAALSKDDPSGGPLLDEEVVVGWTDFLIGVARSFPVSVFKQIRLEDAFPTYATGEDGYVSAEMDRLGCRYGYIENGPVVRHNDWPYADEKVALFDRMGTQRAVVDRHYIRWKLRNLIGRARR
jgi:glycosyltransferase involved in cell wall biosynthesis